MHDRQPGMPGQYKMTIDAAELQKLLNGESCTIVLTRDDQPIAAGTPYNKASVLPDEVAERICPSVLDPTPADAFRNLIARRFTAVLPATGWTGTVAPYTQSVAMDILESETPHVAAVLPDNGDEAEAIQDAFGCITKAKSRGGSILFTCMSDKPERDIPIQIEVVR